MRIKINADAKVLSLKHQQHGNCLILLVISLLTAPLRFDDALGVGIREFQINLVPYPWIHFVLSSCWPIFTAKKEHHEQISVAETINSCFESARMMERCNSRHGKYMVCCLMFRDDVMSKDVSVAPCG